MLVANKLYLRALIMKRSFLLIAILLFTLTLPAQEPVVNTSTEIYQQLKKLNVLGSVLYIAAHPDDENNTLLPYLAKEKMYRTAYLSLTRGDGGQNLIGSEQGIDLGLIRTQELLAARRVDGAEQYFTRAYEFGFSKSAEEALRIWDKEKILADIVYIIRKYQPDVIIKRFPPDQRAGHGHHAASAILADEAFAAAADPTRFPEQLKNGMKPWQAKRLLWNTFNFGVNNTTASNQMTIDVGIYNPLLGKSYGEIGGEARTMHKSQGEGRPRRRGEIIEYFATTAGDPAKNDLMENIVTDWSRLEGGSSVQKMINAIITGFQFEHPEQSVPALVQAYKQIQQLPASAWRNKKLEETQQVIEACTALFAEATTNQENVVQGDTVRATFFFNKRTAVNAVVKRIQFDSFDTTLTNSLGINKNFLINKPFPVEVNKPLTQPYWLVNEQLPGSFDVTDPSQVGNAENEAAYVALYLVNIEGVDFTIERPLKYKVVDPVKGELYQPVAVLPQAVAMVDVNERMIINNQPFKGTISFTSYVPGITLRIKDYLQVPKGVRVEFDADTLYFSEANQTKIVGYKVSGMSTGTLAFGATNDKDGPATKTLHQIRYDHIPTITYFTNATVRTHPVNLKVVGKNIGYITGAGDKVPEALLQMGYHVTLIDEAGINEENLKQFDAIVVGIRAHNIYEYLSNKNEMFNRYVQNGGNLVVQYIKSNTVGLKRVKIGPYPFTISAGSRVTEEDAKVTLLKPQHPVFNYPNKINDSDFEGWVQERSTYQVEQADEHFEKLIQMNDTNNPPTDGSLVIAKYGKGNIAYVSLVLFRQLPAAVPGAYRLMANLIALPRNNTQATQQKSTTKATGK
jgi:LmbE family N-acetylglucosaminyl deacetylase